MRFWGPIALLVCACSTGSQQPTPDPAPDDFFSDGGPDADTGGGSGLPVDSGPDDATPDDSGAGACIVNETRECSCGVGYLGQQGCYSGAWSACVCQGWPPRDVGDECESTCEGMGLPDGIAAVCNLGRCSFECDADGTEVCETRGFDCDQGFCVN